MANTLTVHNATIIAQEALSVLKSNLVLGRLVRRDYEPEVATYGKVIQIPKFGSLTANDKVSGGDRTVQDVTSTSVSITLDKHKESTFIIEDPEKAFSRNDLITGYTQSAMISITEQIETDLFGLYTGFSQQIGVAGTDLAESVIRTARKTLTDAKAPNINRYLVISTKDVNNLLDPSTSGFLRADVLGSDIAARSLTEGAIGRLHGFDVFESQLVPVVAGVPTTHNIAFQKEGIALVIRDLPEVPKGMGTVSSTVSDSESGYSVRARMNYDANRGGIVTTLEVLYGVAEIRDEFCIDTLS